MPNGLRHTGMIAQPWLTAANAVTLLRVLLTPMVVSAVIRGRHREAVAWFMLAAATDFLDGLLARSRQSVSSVGQYFDPLADKFLLSGVFIALAIEGSAPLWFITLVLGRDLAIVVASLIAMRVSTYTDYTPTVWGKISTALQILAAVTLLATNAEGSGAYSAARMATVYAAALGTAFSALHYTWRGVMYFVRQPATEKAR